MCGIFITGSGTDIGKTVITTAVLLSAKRLGVKATVFKPVQTGCFSTSTPEGKTELILPDLAYVSAIATDSLEEAQKMLRNCSYSYAPACSPHLAADLSRTTDISISRIFCDIKEIEKDYELVIVESAGGLMVPLNNYETFRDLAVMLQYETVLVTDNRLGCINDTLLTIEALTNKELPPLGIIMNNTTPATEEDRYIREDNPRIISSYSGVPVIYELPYAADLSRANKEFWDTAAKNLTPIIEHTLATAKV